MVVPGPEKRKVRWPVRFVALYWYRRLRRAYRKHNVTDFYSRRETWDQAKFTVRMKRLP